MSKMSNVKCQISNMSQMYKVKYKGQKTEKDYNDEKELRDNGFGDYIDAYEEKASGK